MTKALDPSTSAWEQLHGIHEIPKPYIPPFMQESHDPFHHSTENLAKMQYAEAEQEKEKDDDESFI